MTAQERFNLAIAKIDEANRADPKQEQLEYSQRLSAELARFAPDASIPLQLAARAQHIKRWEIPRDRYPMTRAGYHQWRSKLYSFHAEQAGAILRAVGYDSATIDRVGTLIRKEQLKTDPEAQVLEDVICLVFLQYEFPDFMTRHPEEKLNTILKKTWNKMSDRGHSAAIALVPSLPSEAQRIIYAALKNS